ncbi:MAG: hypothetical protein M1358_18220 [Chloroflexi bacterium]|nr:hypothetical protein [Chloroflexota bacterium]
MNKYKLFDYEGAPDRHCGVLRVNIPVLRLLPPEASRHLLAARREMLLALRSLVDADLRLFERE